MTDHNTIDRTQLFSLDPDWFYQVIIRRLRRADLPALEWEGEFTRFRNVYAEVYKRMHDGVAYMWGADLPEVGLIGQVFVQFNTNRAELADGFKRAYIHSFRVQPAYRRAGVGTLLMETAEEDLVGRGFREVSLNVTYQNPDARRLYERLGYQVISEDPGRWWYYDQNNRMQEVHEPGWRMLKALVE
jgi:ribosomal protein S18 acetylase RimI-like enzyme